jgi:hypothetical protein
MLHLMTLFMTMGCASSNVTTAELDAALAEFDDVSISDETFKPRDGDWTYTSRQILSDSCANAIYMLDLGAGFETDRSGKLFDITFQNNDSAKCSIGSDSFDCQPRVEAQEYDTKLTLTSTYDTRGQMLSRDDMEGVHELTISCSGAGCPVLEAAEGIRFPCRFGGFFTADTRG